MSLLSGYVQMAVGAVAADEGGPSSSCPPGSGVARAGGGWQHNSVDYVLAQVNVARLRAPLDSPLLADFVAGLDPVNATADAAPGFIWRLQTEDGNATSVRAFEWDAAGSAGVLVRPI